MLIYSLSTTTDQTLSVDIGHWPTAPSSWSFFSRHKLQTTHETDLVRQGMRRETWFSTPNAGVHIPEQMPIPRLFFDAHSSDAVFREIRQNKHPGKVVE